MNYSGLYFDDTVNGLGYRTSLFVSGCGKYPRCEGCYNEIAWDFSYGELYTEQIKMDIVNSMTEHATCGLSILGGEPFSNLESGELIDLVKTIKTLHPDKTIYVWSGFLYEDLIKDKKSLEFLKHVDMLRDGEFVEKLKDVTQYLSGSKNQRCIDVQESIKQDRIINYNFK